MPFAEQAGAFLLMAYLQRNAQREPIGLLGSSQPFPIAIETNPGSADPLKTYLTLQASTIAVGSNATGFVTLYDTFGNLRPPDLDVDTVLGRIIQGVVEIPVYVDYNEGRSAYKLTAQLLESGQFSFEVALTL